MTMPKITTETLITLMQRVGLVLLLLVISASRARAAVETEVAPEEPAPAPLELPEPAPPPLTEAAPPPVDRVAAAASAQKMERQAVAERSARRLRGLAWSSVAATVALVTSGTVLGVLAQRRSDELSLLVAPPATGQPPIYDSTVADRYTSLDHDGQTYNRAAIACFIVSGVTALASGLLFWDLTKSGSSTATEQRLTLLPSISPQGGLLSLAGRF